MRTDHTMQFTSNRGFVNPFDKEGASQDMKGLLFMSVLPAGTHGLTARLAAHRILRIAIGGAFIPHPCGTRVPARRAIWTPLRAPQGRICPRFSKGGRSMSAIRPRGQALIDEINRTRLPDGAIALWYLGQSGFAVKGGERVIYLDPYLSDFLEHYTVGRPDADPRHFQPPLSPEDLTNADWIFGSHYHYDHIDPTVFLAACQVAPTCRFVVPPAARAPLLDMGVPADRIIAVPVDQPQALDGVQCVSIPAAHEGLDYDPETGYPYTGYIVTLGGVTIYHAGDCAPYPGLLERLKPARIDVALLPINGRDYFRLNRGFPGNFTYREAAELAATVHVDLLIPMHFGMHMANTERVGYLVDYLADHFPSQKCHVMVPGERLLYLKHAEGGLVGVTP
jgi:L-ascorbate 6-phosphate lactonase